MLSGAAVSLSQDLSHLSIKCASTSNNSQVSFYNAGIYTPSEIRIYKPSLHTYDGVPADAELLIMHSIVSSNSDIGTDGLIVSVPISMGGSNRSELNTIIQSANALNAGTVSLNSSVPISSVIDVNDFIPSKPYYVYNGTLPYDSCGGNYYYAVFADPISISTPINNLTPSGIKIAPPPALLQKSKTGPMNGMGTNAGDEYVLFEVMDTSESDHTDPSLAYQNKASKVDESFLTTVNILWGILIVFVLWVIYKMFTVNVNVEGTIGAATSLDVTVHNP
jgi:hypothetical protein